jgi:uncharacterized membrane protein
MRDWRIAVSVWVVLATLCAAPGMARADVTATVCNRSSAGAWVGFAYPTEAKWATSGWWWTEAGGCTEPVTIAASKNEVYVYANTEGDDVEWQGDKSLCVSMEGEFDYADADAADCGAKRSFKKYVAGADGAVNVELKDDDSVRVAYNLTLCNRTDDWVSVALGHSVEKKPGISTDGWYSIAPRGCETYIRRGAYDTAYFFAQTGARQLVWHGQLPLCTRYHDSFEFAAADSDPCRDGDSEKLPFVKKALAKGRAQVDLDAGTAQVFKNGLNLCNAYSEDIYPAIAHLDGVWMNGMLARGFWRLRPGECKLVDAVGTSSVYLYAETDDVKKTWTGKDLNGCVRTEGFTFPGVDKVACDGGTDRRAGFFVWSVSEGPNVYKFE